MAVLRSGRGASKPKPACRPFKDIISEIGRASAMAKPKYADSTKKGNMYVWARWVRFCQKIYDESDKLPSPDPVAAASKDTLTFALVRAFLYWNCQQSNIGSSNSLFTFGKAWRMAVIENVRVAVDPAIKLDMKNYMMDTLIAEFELKETCRFRSVMSADDLIGCIYHHWALSDDYYPEERQRIQHPGAMIFCASTTARAGTVVESSGYYGHNDALQYGDIELFAVRDDQLGGIKLGLLVSLRLLKGRRNRGNPPKIKFMERRDTPSFCFVKILLGLAFRDQAFLSQWICKPEDIYNIRIPARLKAVPIEWAESWKAVPIFRRTVRNTKGNIHTSPTLALQYNQLANWNRRLGRSWGMKDPFEFKILRRAAAAALTKSVPEGVRNQAMGHSSSQIHDKYYQNQTLDADIVSAFLDQPSDGALMKLMGHTSLTRDPQAPAKPTSVQCKEARNDPKVVEKRKKVAALTKAFRDRHGPIRKARERSKDDAALAEALDTLDSTKRHYDKLYKQRLAILFEKSRAQYFATLGATCLENQHLGHVEPEGPTIIQFRFRERAELVKLLFPLAQAHAASSQDEQIRDSCQIIRLYASLAERREAPRSRQQPESSGDVETPEVRPCFLDTDPDIYPMKCPGTQCLFCLGDTSLTTNIRTRCFSKPYTLTRHVQRQHLDHIPTDEMFPCPHPSCTLDGVRLKDSNHFKAHALREHNIVHSS